MNEAAFAFQTRLMDKHDAVSEVLSPGERNPNRYDILGPLSHYERTRRDLFCTKRWKTPKNSRCDSEELQTYKFCLEWSEAEMQRYVTPCSMGKRGF